MVRPEQGANSSVLHFARNGANRPLHQDRQVLRAGDLSLEQATQDAMLARARRYLHGWGVVAGFAPDVTKKGELAIGPGYGVTPLGDELFLPETVSLPNAAKIVLRSCGPGPLGCDVIDVKARAEAHDAAREEIVTAWLIARPASREAAPRPGVPEGCAHPASTLLPSRRCGGVEFAILCSLPPSHQPKPPDCKELMPFVCGSPRIETPPLPWETPLGAEDNFLVIAELTVSAKEFTAIAGSRRRLLPVSLVQDWVASCLCPVLDKPTRPDGGVIGPGDITDTPKPPPVFEPGVIVQPPHPIPPPVFEPGVIVQPPPLVQPPIVRPDVIVQPPSPVQPPIVRPDVTIQPPSPVQPPIVRPDVTIQPPSPVQPPIVRPDVITQPSSPVQPPPVISTPPTPVIVTRPPHDSIIGVRERLTADVTEITGVGAARAKLLGEIGVKTEGEFLAAPSDQLARTLNLPETKVIEMKEEVNARHNLGLTFR